MTVSEVYEFSHEVDPGGDFQKYVQGVPLVRCFVEYLRGQDRRLC